MNVPTAALQAGVLLRKKYRLEQLLSSGSMSVVWAASHELTRERVAIKFLSPGRGHDEQMVRRFLREARATAKLRGDHVARVFDVDTLEFGTPFLVMEYLEGTTLLRHMSTHGRLSPAQSVTWVLEACSALAEAHALGIVHRDVKPANFFLVARPDGSRTIKVLDFGIAKRLSGPAHETADGAPPPSSSFDTTGEGLLLGSPGYMAPEQITAPAKVDPRADIWALGVILFEMLSGQRPFAGSSLPETITQVLHAAPPPLLKLCPGLPPGLAPVVERCLEKDRERRFASVDALASALAPFGPPGARPALAPHGRAEGRYDQAEGPYGPGEVDPALSPTIDLTNDLALAPSSSGSGVLTLTPFVTSQELIYYTQPVTGPTIDEQDLEPPPSQLDTIAVPTLREPPRFLAHHENRDPPPDQITLKLPSALDFARATHPTPRLTPAPHADAAKRAPAPAHSSAPVRVTPPSREGAPKRNSSPPREGPPKRNSAPPHEGPPGRNSPLPPEAAPRRSSAPPPHEGAPRRATPQAPPEAQRRFVNPTQFVSTVSDKGVRVDQTVPLATVPVRPPFASRPPVAEPPPSPPHPPDKAVATPLPPFPSSQPPPRPKAPAPPRRKVDTPLIAIVVVAALGSALLTMTLARQCSGAGAGVGAAER